MSQNQAPSVTINVTGPNGTTTTSASAPAAPDALAAALAAQPAREASSCVCTVIRAGKAGDITLEIAVGSTVAEAAVKASLGGTDMTYKKQTNDGPIVDVQPTSKLGEGTHRIFVSPKVAGGSN